MYQTIFQLPYLIPLSTYRRIEEAVSGISLMLKNPLKEIDRLWAIHHPNWFKRPAGQVISCLLAQVDTETPSTQALAPDLTNHVIPTVNLCVKLQRLTRINHANFVHSQRDLFPPIS